MREMFAIMAILIGGLLLAAPQAVAQAPAEHPVVTTENYYKAIPGRQQEFLRLYMKNHYPLLAKELAAGKVISFKIESPAVYMSEDVRWDFRVTIVSREKSDPAAEAELKKQLWPDQETFTREEKERFDCVLAHWDVTLNDLTPARP